MACLHDECEARFDRVVQSGNFHCCGHSCTISLVSDVERGSPPVRTEPLCGNVASDVLPETVWGTSQDVECEGRDAPVRRCPPRGATVSDASGDKPDQVAGLVGRDPSVGGLMGEYEPLSRSDHVLVSESDER